ncbi:MAG: family 16 glycosylhydrolase, partial [Gammaproteobacteria bacterium]|nr:family 16 glycosylhydrolase [Gammaproteobacteria bacterium]
LSAIDTVPVADPTTQTNQNSNNPVLNTPTTFPVAPGDALTLVWSDEFNAAALDPEIWFFATGDGSEVGLPGGWGNNELQYYLPDNAQLEDGILKITARRESIGGLNYTSARLNTEDRFAFQYGRIEASIKLPSGQGLWPAFWMLSQDSDYLCNGEPCIWAAVGEIDIVEAINLDGTNGNDIFATIHYGDEFPGNQSSSVTYTPGRDVTETFNTYAMEWGPDEIRWYFNDELYATQTSWFSTAENGGPRAPFDQPFHILLNLAVGGNFPGNGIDGAAFPATMEVDWVRVYSGPDTFVPADPGTVPDAVVYATDPAVMEDLGPPGGIQNFGSGAVFDPAFAGDRDFNPVLATTSGDAYDPGNVQVGFAAFTGYMQGFASGFGTLDFKVKGLPTGEIEVKFFGGDGGDGSADNAINYNVTTYTGSTALGNGWYQVSIPLSDFETTIAINEGFLLGPPGDQGAQFTFFMTDIGFSGTAGGGGGELLTNGDFEASPTDKAPWINAGAVFVNNYYTVEAFDGGNVFDTNLSQVLPIVQGADYVLTFQARATVDRDIIAGIGLNVGPFTADTRSVSLTTEWQTFSLNLNAVADIGTAESRVLFDMGTVASMVHIDDVNLALASAPGVNLLSNSDFQTSDTDKAPWINAGGITTNNYYTADALDGEPVFVTNLSQVIPLTTGGDYVLSFRARANIARDIIAGIGLNVPNFENDSATVSLSTDWQAFTLNLNAFDPIGTAESRVLFDMGGTTSTVDIDDVSLIEAAPFDSGLLSNGDFQAGPDPWLAGVFNPIDPMNVVSDGSNSYFSVDVLAAGNAFDVNLSQILPITPNETYTLTFMARSDVSRTMLAGIGLSGGSFANT